MRIMYVLISIICFSSSTVIVDMLNTFIKNYNYRVLYYIQEWSDNLMKCTKILFSHWLIWRWRLLNKHYRFRKMEMEVFVHVQIPVISTVAYNFIKRNKILQPNNLIYFKAILDVIQRTMIAR